MNDDIAIKVDHVSKTFKLPHEKTSSIKGALIGLIRGGKRTYEKQQVLSNVSFDIKKGEFFGIVGRNGSGKSTMLKLLAGIYSPTKGSVQVNGKLTPFIELGVGFNPELTGRENVYLNGALLGFSRKEMDTMYADIVAFAELEQFMDQKLKNYSSGMQVRLAFSVAIRAETDILLIDEVLAVGDQSFQEKCFDFFSKIKSSEKTVIFVTHDMSSVERFCDRVLILDKKKEVNGLYTIPEAVSIYNKLNHQKAESIDFEKRDVQGLHLQKVTLQGKDGKELSTFEQGEELNIDIKLGGKPQTKERITIGLAFYDKDNMNLAGPNSVAEAFTTAADTIRYTIRKLPFNMGEYYVTVALLNENGSAHIDLVDKGLKFFVNTPRIYHGKIILDATWSEK